MEILDEIKKDYIIDLMKKNKRPDDRGYFDYRPCTVEKGIFESAEGSARVKLGKTQVVAGVKIEMGTPFKDRPGEGVLSTTAELLPLASPTFEPGPPDECAIELARIVDRGIRSSNTIDLESLFIEKDKVLMIFVDVYVLDHDGNLIDASALASMAALLNAKVPKIEDGKLIKAERIDNLKITQKVVTCTFSKIGSQIVLDPRLDEEKAMSARLTLATTPEHVCAMQKGGKGAFTSDELINLVDASFEKGNELRKLLD
ncbi:MAG: exosome complex protein Rrp42 [Candidatus Micrarchaeota archaeon]|nr:exosome complex protein Rrp42 [Candidatus Micrarchaeota archaeon]